MRFERGVEKPFATAPQDDTAHLLPKPGEKTSLLMPNSPAKPGAPEPFFDTHLLYEHPKTTSRPEVGASTVAAKEARDAKKTPDEPGKDGAACGPASKPPLDKDMTIDGATRHKVIDSLAKDLKEHYIHPERADEAINAIRKLESSGRYDRLTGANDFSDRLGADLQLAADDKHLRVDYREKLDNPNPSPEERAAQIKLSNAGFHATVLPGNIGYLKIDRFFDTKPGSDPKTPAMDKEAIAKTAPMVKEAIAKEFAKVANTDALIIDNRENGGGDPNTVLQAHNHILKPGTTVNTIQWREGSERRVEEFKTSNPEDGISFGSDKPIYVLTSQKTFSGGEEFAYDLQKLKRAKIVGEHTGGGANPGDWITLQPHFNAFIPTGTSINPYSHSNWEGDGVKPDVGVPCSRALDVARSMVLQDLINHSTGTKRQELLHLLNQR